MNLSPGADLKLMQKAKAGEVVTLAPGGYRGGIALSDLHGVTLCLTGATISGGADGLKFTNCSSLAIDGGTVQDAGAYGWFFDSCQHVTLNGVAAVRCGTTGILTTRVDDFNALGCQVSGSVQQWGIYISERASKVRITGGTYQGCGRGAVQVNCDKGGGTDIEVRGIVADGNQLQGHASAIQFAYVTNGRILNNRIINHAGRVGVEVWQKSKAITVDGNSFGFAPTFGAACVSVSGDSKATVGLLNIADPRVPLLGKG